MYQKKLSSNRNYNQTIIDGIYRGHPPGNMKISGSRSGVTVIPEKAKQKLSRWIPAKSFFTWNDKVDILLPGTETRQPP